MGKGGALGGIDRFERLMERAVEGSVGRMFRSQVQPAEIGRRLERAMEARPLISVDGTIVPNDYRVHLNPEDAVTFKEIEAPLCQSFEQWLGEIAAERGYRFMGPVHVRLVDDPQVGRRDVQVQTALEAPAAPARPAPRDPPPYHGGPQGAAEERTRLGESSPRPRMVAPVAGVPVPRAPSGPLPQGVVAHLAVQSGALAGRTFPLRFADVAIGRALDNDVVLDSNDVSRHHARIEPAGTLLRLIDLGSTNGTRVNRRRVSEHLLRDGDVMELGSTQLLFRVGDPAASL
ncbi:MAG: FhaA domain-containing protein [Thermomicrobiales bacterium]